MPKVVVSGSGAAYGSYASNGSTVVFTQHKNPDGSVVKDTRT